MRTFECICFEIAFSSLQPVCCLAKTEIKSDFKCLFFTVTVFNLGNFTGGHFHSISNKK